jgi:replicative DNA helicase
LASVASIRSALRRLDRDLRRRNGAGLALACVDYLGLVAAPERGMGLYEATTKNSQALKGMARELGLPVLVLAQLSRAVESRTDKHPQLSDLRDSGAIEQDADAVFGLYREAYYALQDEPGEGAGAEELLEHQRKQASRALDVDILKQRGGETGRVKLYCDPATGEIADMERDAA